MMPVTPAWPIRSWQRSQRTGLEICVTRWFSSSGPVSISDASALEIMAISGVRTDMDGINFFTSATAERSEEHTSELQSRGHLVCRLLLVKKKKIIKQT